MSIKKQLPLFLKWHRYVGLLIIPVILMVVITGIIINHCATCSWKHSPVYSKVIGKLYGIPSPKVKAAFSSLNFKAVHIGDHLYLNQQPWSECHETLIGFVVASETMASLCGQSLSLWTVDGQLIEILETPSPTEKLGLANDSYIILSNSKPLSLNEMEGVWNEFADMSQVTWSTPLSHSKDVLDIDTALPGITKERVLLDLHSGRLFGLLGVIIVDIAALLLLFLAGSGLFVWIKRRPKKKTKRSAHRI